MSYFPGNNVVSIWDISLYSFMHITNKTKSLSRTKKTNAKMSKYTVLHKYTPGSFLARGQITNHKFQFKNSKFTNKIVSTPWKSGSHDGMAWNMDGTKFIWLLQFPDKKDPCVYLCNTVY